MKIPFKGGPVPGKSCSTGMSSTGRDRSEDPETEQMVGDAEAELLIKFQLAGMSKVAAYVALGVMRGDGRNAAQIYCELSR